MAARKKMRARGPRSTPEAEAGGGTGTMTGGMGNLAEDIMHSFDTRMERLAAIRERTAEQLGAVRREMRAMAARLRTGATNLRRFLSDAEASRRAETGQLMDGFRREHDARARAWQHLVATMEGKRAAVRP